MIFRPRFFLFAALLVCATAMAWADPALFCDNSQYSPLQLSWDTPSELTQVENVFPHPSLPERAVVTTVTGLLITNDAGVTWTALPEAGVEKVGPIQAIVFHPTKTDTFYLGSRTKGIWVTADAGKSFRQIGSAANGMAGDEVADVIIYPGDGSYQTLLAVHGNKTPGLSRSRDDGKSWAVFNPEYCFRRVLCQEWSTAERLPELYLFGSAKKEPDIQNLYTCATPVEYPVELMHDALLTDMTFTRARNASLYVATSDNGLFHIDSVEHDITPVPSKEGNGWSSVSAIWGPNADVLNLCLYDASKAGMVLSGTSLANMQAESGLIVGSLVRDGASIRPNATGIIYYSVANGTLTIGRPASTVPVVEVTPSVVEPSRADFESVLALDPQLDRFYATGSNVAMFAKALQQKVGDLSACYRRFQLNITARLPILPSPPVSVTVDMSRFGGASDTPLYDDGAHGDGAAGDGVYGRNLFFLPLTYQFRGDDWRPAAPGRMAFGVTATYADGHKEASVGVVGIYPKLESFDFWNDIRGFNAEVEGDVKAAAVANPRPEVASKGDCALRIEAHHGSWSVIVRTPYSRGEITGYQGLAFWIKADGGQAPKDLFVQLRDEGQLTAPVTTTKISALHDGMREATIGSDYQRIVLPFSRLVGSDTPLFNTSRVSRIIFSGDGEAPTTLLINGVRYLATPAELEAPDQTPSK